MKSFWPIWFPYPISWLRAAWVLSAFICTVQTVFTKELLAKTINTEHSLESTLVIYAVLILLCWLSQFLIIAIYHWIFVTLVHFLITSWWPSWLVGYERLQVNKRKPNWKKLIDSVREGLNAIIVLLVLGLVAWIVCRFVFNHVLLLSLIADWCRSRLLEQEGFEPQVRIVAFISLSIGAYLYQYDFLVRRWRTSRKLARTVGKGAKVQTKSQKQNSSQRSLTIEEELDQLKQQIERERKKQN